jgi:hypothetical protein
MGTDLIPTRSRQFIGFGGRSQRASYNCNKFPYYEESTRSWPFIIFIDENQTVTVLSAVDDVPMVQTTNLHYCIDNLIEQKMLKMQIADIDREILRYIIFIAAVTVLSILIIIAQCNFVRLQQRLSPYLPENSIDRFVHQHQLCRIRRRLHIDYDRRLGDGKWSTVYYGMCKFIRLDQK